MERPLSDTQTCDASCSSNKRTTLGKCEHGSRELPQISKRGDDTVFEHSRLIATFHLQPTGWRLQVCRQDGKRRQRCGRCFNWLRQKSVHSYVTNCPRRPHNRCEPVRHHQAVRPQVHPHHPQLSGIAIPCKVFVVY